jgi:hypothetical protein
VWIHSVGLKRNPPEDPPVGLCMVLQGYLAHKKHCDVARYSLCIHSLMARRRCCPFFPDGPLSPQPSFVPFISGATTYSGELQWARYPCTVESRATPAGSYTLVSLNLTLKYLLRPVTRVEKKERSYSLCIHSLMARRLCCPFLPDGPLFFPTCCERSCLLAYLFEYCTHLLHNTAVNLNSSHLYYTKL